eukprot:scaffold2613_cov188-Amphora_coffeaeformis.AAC.1
MIIGSIPAFVILLGTFALALMVDIFIAFGVSIALAIGSSTMACGVDSKGRYLRVSQEFLRNFWEGDQKSLTNPDAWIDFPVGCFSLPFVLQLGMLNTLELSGSAELEAGITWLFLLLFLIVTYMIDVVATIVAVMLFLIPICTFSVTVWLTIFGAECSSNGLQNTVEALGDFLKASWDKQEEATKILCNVFLETQQCEAPKQPKSSNDDDQPTSSNDRDPPEMPTNSGDTETSCEI